MKCYITNGKCSSRIYNGKIRVAPITGKKEVKEDDAQ